MATHTSQAVFGTLSSADDTSHEACCYHISRPVQKRSLLQDSPPCGKPQIPLYRPEVMKTIEDEIDRVTEELRTLNTTIWKNPELRYEEENTHKELTAFMENQGFEVTKEYKSDFSFHPPLKMKTAWRAEFSYKADSGPARTLGVNSEMDALPVAFERRAGEASPIPSDVSHACGHNLIAVAGVAVAIAVKKALQVHDVPGKVVLLGTPAEESGQGKVRLLEAGAYVGMDACVMMHPGSGPNEAIAVKGNLANQRIKATYKGRPAHAAVAPWQGTNAQDAVMLAYTAVSMLRQQLHPDLRVHGVVSYDTSHPPAPNVIPAEMSFIWNIRAPNEEDLKDLDRRVRLCIGGAATATGCTVDYNDRADDPVPNLNLRQNPVLAKEFQYSAGLHLGLVPHEEDDPSAKAYSTDFGNVTYEVPGIHPVYSIVDDPTGSSHTPEFARSAGPKDVKAHDQTMKVAKALAFTGFRVLDDDEFFSDVKKAFDGEKALGAEKGIDAE